MRHLRAVILLSAAALAFSDNADGQVADTSSERRDALSVLQVESDKLYQDGLIPNGDVDRVVLELAAIRAFEPMMARVHAALLYQMQTLLLSVKELAPTALDPHRRRLLLEKKVSNPLATGVPSWDSLNRKFGATKISLLQFGEFDGCDVLSILYKEPAEHPCGCPNLQ